MRIETILSDLIDTVSSTPDMTKRNKGKLVADTVNKIVDGDPLHELAALLQTKYHAAIHLTKNNQSDLWDLKLLGINNIGLDHLTGPDPYKLIRYCINKLKDGQE